MSKPAPGAPAWVELYVGQEQTFMYFPFMNKNVIPGDALQEAPALDAGIHFAVPAALDLRGWQRLFQQVLTSNTEYLLVDVPKYSPEAIFGLNWSDPAGQAVILDLLDPDGFSVKPDAVYTRPTHTQWLVRDPKAGQWKVFVRISKQVEGMELYRKIGRVFGQAGGNRDQ